MKYKNIIIVFALLAVGFSACNRDEIFEREQYKQVIAVKSDGIFKIFGQDIDLDQLKEGYFDGFISATVGGSLPTEKPIKINIEGDGDLLNQYNEFSFAQQTYLYAQLIPNYTISDYSINIPAGERTGTMKIRVNPTGLSPDSVYMLPFRVTGVSEYEMNQDKSTVLYRIYLKNFYSTTRNIPSYSHKGVQTPIDVSESQQLPVNTMASKVVHPVEGNSVRLFAGNGSKIFETNARDLDQLIVNWAIKLTMDKDGKVTITPWNTTSPHAMKVEQVDHPCGLPNCKVCDPEGYENAAAGDKINCHYDPYYSNTFAAVDDGWGRKFKTFYLSYKFTDPESGRRYMMKEELKLEYKTEVK